jgi:hypothetical protein
VVFVCETDGLVTLPFSELHDIVDFHQTDNAWVSVSRPPRAQYAIAGNKDELDRKVARGVGIILETMRTRVREKYAITR